MCSNCPQGSVPCAGCLHRVRLSPTINVGAKNGLAIERRERLNLGTAVISTGDRCNVAVQGNTSRCTVGSAGGYSTQRKAAAHFGREPSVEKWTRSKATQGRLAPAFADPLRINDQLCQAPRFNSLPMRLRSPCSHGAAVPSSALAPASAATGKKAANQAQADD